MAFSHKQFESYFMLKNQSIHQNRMVLLLLLMLHN